MAEFKMELDELAARSNFFVADDTAVIVAITYEVDPAVMLTYEMHWLDGEKVLVQYRAELDGGEDVKGTVEKRILLRGDEKEINKTFEGIRKKLKATFYPYAKELQAEALQKLTDHRDRLARTTKTSDSKLD